MDTQATTSTPSPTIYKKLKEAVTAIQKLAPTPPKIGVILGSGLGPVADRVKNPVVIPYSEIPHFHGTSVEGHAGKMILGELASIPVVILMGRFHLYEGYPMEDVVFPTRTICALGIQTMILTNAAGGINTTFRPKDLMIIDDHVNMMGDNPLKGPHLKELGPRFPDMTHAYSPRGNTILLQAAEALNIPIKRGVYAGMLGPTYETPAEVHMLRTLGADAVGMSTVPESIAANHLGVEVVGMSSITNLAAGISAQKLNHEEVVENSKVSADQVSEILTKSIPLLAKTSSS